MTDTIEGHWQSPDGLTLSYREYPAGGSPVLCLHGLTRNGRDFVGLAGHLQRQGHRVIVPDMRGRGQSDYADDPASYTVPTYVRDVKALLEQLRIDRLIAIGTSMGGLITMLLAADMPGLVAGAVLNDIGPVVEEEGLAAIRGYVGQQRSFPTWMHAARALRELHGAAHPTFALEDWLSMAKRGLRQNQSGRISYDYDMKIAEPIFQAAGDNATVPPDLWHAFDRLAEVPLLVLRGELSRLLSDDTMVRMIRHDGVVGVTIPEVGHAPTLDEPQSRAAIDRVLETFA